MQISLGHLIYGAQRSLTETLIQESFSLIKCPDQIQVRLLTWPVGCCCSLLTWKEAHYHSHIGNPHAGLGGDGKR